MIHLRQMRDAIMSKVIRLAQATSVILVMLEILYKIAPEDNINLTLDLPRFLFILCIIELAPYWASETGRDPPANQGVQVHLLRSSFLSLFVRMILDVFLVFAIFSPSIYSIKNYLDMDEATEYYLWVIPMAKKVETHRYPVLCKTVLTMVHNVSIIAMIYACYRAVLLAIMFLHKGVMFLTNLMARDEGVNQVEAPAIDIGWVEVQDEGGNP